MQLDNTGNAGHQAVSESMSSSSVCSAPASATRSWATMAGNWMVGCGGNDSVRGGGGNDTLYGSEGNDVLNGGSDNDTLFGGSGSNVLTGGSGRDVYVFDAPEASAGSPISALRKTRSSSIAASSVGLARRCRWRSVRWPIAAGRRSSTTAARATCPMTQMVSAAVSL